MKSLALFLALSAVGCSDVHALPLIDAGSPLVPDSAPSPSRSCRVASPSPMPAWAGEGCYCDGPFAVRGTFAYRQTYRLETIDISVPGAPRLLGSQASHAFYSSDVGVVGDVLFTAGGAMERFDLRDPAHPTSLGVLDIGGQATAMAIDGARVVAAIARDATSSALVPIDAHDPRAPVVGRAVELGALGVGTIALRGTLAFAAARDAGGASRIVAIDFADVRAPRMLGTLATSVSWLASVGVHDSRLFIGGLDTGVRAIDVSDPSAMRDLGVVIAAAPGEQAVAVTGDVLVVSGSGLALYDLASPGLAPLGHTDVAANAPHALIADGQLLGSSGSALFSIPLDCR